MDEFEKLEKYTGEDEDPPIFVEKVLEIDFRFRDDVTGKETEICADAKLLESANNIVCENNKEIADHEDR